MESIKPCLMFVGDQHGKAEEAITLYTSIFGNSELLSLIRYDEGDIDLEGTVKVASFTINGVEHMAMDSGTGHSFHFTPAISFFIECESADELEDTFNRLIEDGEALMPVDDYGFSRKFGWVKDKYGVTWQLNLS